MRHRASRRGVRWLFVGSPLLTAPGIGMDAGQRLEASIAAEPVRKAVTKRGSQSAPATPSTPRFYGISGRVVDPHGDPILDAEVWLEDMSGDGRASAPIWLGTDSNGRFAAPEVRPALYTITAAARGFAPRAIAVELNREVADLGFLLVPAPSPRAVVLDPEGRTVSDAVVVACSQSSEVTLHSAPDGTVSFAPGAIGCSARAHHLRFTRSAPARLGPDGVAVLRLERGGAIEGVVTDTSGRALFDCEVSVNGFDPSEDEQALAGSLPELRVQLGREFRFSGLAPGSYSLTVSRHLRVGEEVSIEELISSSFVVLPGRVVRAVHLVAQVAQAVTDQ